MRKTEWIAFATLMLTVIGAAVGAAWWTGARMATKDDLAVLRQELRLEIRTLREHADAQMAELRLEIQTLREHVDAQMAELRLEIQTLREHVDAQMAELRGYVIDHLNGHPVD